MDANKKTNALVLADRPAALLPITSVQDLQTLGAVLAQSQLFGAKNPAEGLAIVAMCQQKRISWMDFMETFHMIKGRVTKKTDAILADFHRQGGKHIVVSRTPECAEAKFTNGETSYISKITWEDCKAEPFIYQGKEDDVVNALERGDASRLAIKAKYRTPRSRMQMLWARCVSDGVRVVAPECVQGIYTPEETDDFVEDAPRMATPVQTSAPSVPVEICPCGKAVGKRWDDEAVFSVPVLKQALSAVNPLITPAMKDYIRGIVASREATVTIEEEEGGVYE